MQLALGFLLLFSATALLIETDADIVGDVCGDKTTGMAGPVALPIADTNAFRVSLNKKQRPSAQFYANCKSQKITKCVFASKTVDLLTPERSSGDSDQFEMTTELGANENKPYCCFTCFSKMRMDLTCYQTLNALKLATHQ